jgi:hypothetical protein
MFDIECILVYRAKYRSFVDIGLLNHLLRFSYDSYDIIEKKGKELSSKELIEEIEKQHMIEALMK